mmetsp:Transcript_4865/g.11904  ORF Transcript_4865/g.11904 Transcript_4865/m.11904 type:complete len:242 (+) Transcript_4865:590-1315(+)
MLQNHIRLRVSLHSKQMIDTLLLLFLGHPQVSDVFEQQRKQPDWHATQHKHNGRAHNLPAKQLRIPRDEEALLVVKQADGGQTPNPTAAMHGEGFDDVVDLTPRSQPNAQFVEHRADGADEHSPFGLDGVAPCGDGDQASQDSVGKCQDVMGDAAATQGLGDGDDGAREPTRAGRKRRGQCRIRSQLRVRTRGHRVRRAGVEPVPANPQDQSAAQHAWHGRGREEVKRCGVPPIAARAHEV